MKLYKSFKEISNKYSLIENLFENKKHILAHTHFRKPNETLHEHTHKVKKYFLTIIEINNLESIINNIILKISHDNFELGEYLKVMFFQVIIFHDFGKINPNFQVDRMGNSHSVKDNSIKVGYKHSFISAYSFISFCTDKLSKNLFGEDKRISYIFSFLFSIPILKHHSGQIEKDYLFSEDKIDSIYYLINNLPFDITKEQVKKLIDYEKSNDQKNLWYVFNNIAKKQDINYFPIFTLLKLNYSLLTAADYYATSEYMNGLEFETEEDFGLLTDDLKHKIDKHFTNNKDTDYNGRLIKDKDYYLNYPIADLQKPSNDNLNILRQKLGAEVLANIEKYKNENIFYIEAPTGGGKTNMSMIAIYKMLQIHPEINKIFYVFPFTTLITQTAQAIKETIGLSDFEIAQVHSKAGYQTKEYENAKYGKELRNQIDNLFVNYPLTLLTHIKFFDILKSNQKSVNYQLHRLANSVIIIDELQSYPPEHWDKIKYYISQYAKLFNIRFIIMSATLPKIDRIKNIFDTHFESLIPNAKEYLQNNNFSKRVEIITDLLEKDSVDLPQLATIVLNKSLEYAINRSDEYKNNVYTIIEFIFKGSASEFFQIITEQNNNFFDKIFVLSGSIIEPRRKYIIEYLKDENNRKKKILLITTQVVEAGVDIDMDIGFKNQSLIDSDEQLAGRINRNVKKENCKLWLFKYDTPKSIYGKDLRYNVTAKYSSQEIKDILNNKDFERLYIDVFKEIEKKNNSVWKSNLSDYLFHIERLNFKNIHDKFKLIDSQNATVFVPINIDINCYNKIDNFSDSDIIFIANNNCLCNNRKQVSGEKIWELYVSIIQNKDINFSKKKTDLKIMNGIISKFVFSVFLNNLNSLKPYLDNNAEFDNYEAYQYYKLLSSEIGDDKIYSYKSGLNESKSKELYEIF